jgi:hypothetical protein
MADHQGDFDESLLKLLRAAGAEYSWLEWVSARNDRREVLPERRGEMGIGP